MHLRASLVVAITVALLFPGASSSGDLSPNGPSPLAELREGFEPPPGGFTETTVHSWSVVSGNASATTDASYSGNYALRIEATEPPGQVAFNLPFTGNSGVLFVDFWIRPVATVVGEAENVVDGAGAQTGFVLIGPQGKLYAYDAVGKKGTWRDTGLHWNASPNGALTQWIRLTLAMTRRAQKWDLYVNGKLVLVNLGLDPTAQDKLVLFGDRSSPVYVDDLYAGTINPFTISLYGLPGSGTAGFGWPDTNGNNTLLDGYELGLMANYFDLLNAGSASVNLSSNASIQATENSEGTSRVIMVDPVDGDDANDGLKASSRIVTAMQARASAVTLDGNMQTLMTSVQATTQRTALGLGRALGQRHDNRLYFHGDQYPCGGRE